MRHATNRENREEHWDMAIEDDSGRVVYTFDVKAWKRGCVDPTSVLVEVKGITGHDGWILGEADFIAFEHTPSLFYIFPRHMLMEYVESRFGYSGDTKFTREKPHGGYQPGVFYGRPGRRDIFIFIPITELMDNVKFYTLEAEQ